MALKTNIFSKKIFSRIAVSMLFVLSSLVSNAEIVSDSINTEDTYSESTTEDTHASAADHHGEEEFDPGKVILEHVMDAHDWHLWGEHDHAVSIPLPVILYTDKGLEFFMSSAFHHGTATVYGNNNYKLVGNKIKVVDEAGVVNEGLSAKVMDFSITKNVASMLLSVVILFVLFGSTASSYKKRGVVAPKGLQSFIEPLVIFVRDDIARPNIGAKADRFMPFLLTVFFFIWVNNILGLLPAGANLTGNIAVTMVLAVITLVVTNVNGNKDYWGHIFKPPVPAWLFPIMIPVEIIGVLSKPFALMVRLFANITAGHIIVLSLISLIFIFKTIAIAPVSIAFVLFMDILELLVAFLQAYIFTMLTALFVGTAVAEHSHEQEHSHH